MLATLLLATLVVAGAAVPLTDGQVRAWPCPLASEIAPCVCTSETDLSIHLDCSNVLNDEDLASVFERTNFPFTDFKSFTINPPNPITGLITIAAGTFGSCTFEKILISNTYIDTVEEEALVYSHPTLGLLDISNNMLVDFPFETLNLFQVLRELRMNNNRLVTLPDVVSDTLLYLDLSENSGITLNTLTFVGVTHLEDLRLRSMSLGTTEPNTLVPDNVFSTNQYLARIDMSRNVIEGELIEMFMNPPFQPIQLLNLDANKIADIHPLAITGLSEGAHVQLTNNLITKILQENWEELLLQVTSDNAIDLRGNPLTCGCDTYWLVKDPSMMKKIHNETKCETLNYLHNLPMEWFLEHCP